jgi:hypothetical protein
MACPDGCPDPDQTLRNGIIHAAHAALNVDRQELRQPSLRAQQHRGGACLAKAKGFPPGGIPATEETDTIRFIKVGDIPEGRKETYLRICSTNRPQKEQTRCICFTVGSNRVEYPGQVSTKTASITTAISLPIE